MFQKLFAGFCIFRFDTSKKVFVCIHHTQQQTPTRASNLILWDSKLNIFSTDVTVHSKCFIKYMIWKHYFIKSKNNSPPYTAIFMTIFIIYCDSASGLKLTCHIFWAIPEFYILNNDTQHNLYFIVTYLFLPS